MALTATALSDVIREVDFMTQPAAVVQALVEKSLTAVIALAATNTPGVDIERLHRALVESQSN